AVGQRPLPADRRAVRVGGGPGQDQVGQVQLAPVAVLAITPGNLARVRTGGNGEAAHEPASAGSLAPDGRSPFVSGRVMMAQEWMPPKPLAVTMAVRTVAGRARL